MALATSACPQGTHKLDNNLVLRLENVSKAFILNPGNANTNTTKKHNQASNLQLRPVLDGLSLEIYEGEFIAIVGPSGCGKSTLLNIIAGLDRPDSGKILVKGEEKKNTDRHRLVVFQESAIFPWLTVWDNIELGLKIARAPIGHRRSIVHHFINLVGLSGFENSYIHQLSGGMKQRVAIARALALDPDILLMDEPFAALDVHTRALLQSELLKIHAETNKTIVFVTHDINEALLLGTRIIVLSCTNQNIIRDISLDIQRPRNINSQRMMELKREILDELRVNHQLAQEK
jgi:NitT/TauT family transport system ATP-binding protein